MLRRRAMARGVLGGAVAMSDQLSESEQLELHWRMTQLTAEGLKPLLIEFMDDHGRISTPADDGPSGEVARMIGNAAT